MKYFLPFVVFISITINVYAQVDMEVVVNNISGSTPISNISVIVTNESIGFTQSLVSSTEGKTTFRGLSTSGKYTITISESSEYYSNSISNITLRSNFNPEFIITLSKKADIALDVVSIKSARPNQINTVNAEVSSELKIEEIKSIPVEGRDITRVLYRLPNVTQATGFFPEAPNVSINGSNGLFTNYLIDGLDNNEHFLGGQRFAMPVGFTQNITVLTNNFSAEYGLTANGIVNITSKSGSNNFSGEAFLITRPGAVIDAESPYAQRDLSGNQVLEGFQRYQAGFGFGGAIKPDKTFYYFNVEYTKDIKDNFLNSPELGVNETVRGENNFTYISGKIDHNWTNKFRSSLRVNTGVVNIDRQGGGLTGGILFPSAGDEQDRNSANIALKNNYVGDKFSMETNYLFGRFRWNYSNANFPDNPGVLVIGPDDVSIAQIGHPGYMFNELGTTNQFQQKFNFYLNKHTIKTGAEVLSTKHDLFGGGTPSGFYTVKLTQDQLDVIVASGVGADLNVDDIPTDVEVLNYSIELMPKSFGATQTIFSLYAEDEVKVSNKLNITIGVRYDVDNLSKGGGTKLDLNNIGPRLSANYKINNHNSIRLGYGIFYDKINYALYSDALQQNSTNADYKAQLQELIDQGILPAETDLDLITYDGNLSASFSPVTYLEGPGAEELQGQREDLFSYERRILNPNGYQNPYAHQFMIGYQYQISDNKLFYIDLVYNRSYNLFRLVDLNSPEAYLIDENFDPSDVRPQSEADLTRPIPIYGNYAIINGDTLNGIAKNIVMTETAGESKYYAASFNFQKDRAEDNYALRIIYTLSLLENNTEDINFKAMDANNFDNEWGPSINDRTHVINTIYTLYPCKNFSVTVAGLLQSGQPINRIPDASVYGTTDLNGDGRSFGNAYVGNSDRSPGEERNSGRLPWNTLFDLGAQYDFKVGEGALQLRADVFNILNAENLSGYSNNATQSNQIQIGPSETGNLQIKNSAPPRQFQFSLLYNFN